MTDAFRHLLERNPRPHPLCSRFPSRSRHPGQPPSWRITRHFLILTGCNPAPSTPSSTPKSRTAFLPQPTLSSTLFWTTPVPSGSPFPQSKAPLGAADEVNKEPNFIELYKLSRSLDSSGTASPGRKIALHQAEFHEGNRAWPNGSRPERTRIVCHAALKKAARTPFCKPQSAFGSLVLKETNR